MQDDDGREWTELAGDAVADCVLVGTRSGSCYLIDLLGMRLKRMPAIDDERVLKSGGFQPVSQPLRRDGQWLKIIHLGPIAIGQRLDLMLEPLGDPRFVVVTHRLTTEVVTIDAIEPPRDSPSQGTQP